MHLLNLFPTPLPLTLPISCDLLTPPVIRKGRVFKKYSFDTSLGPYSSFYWLNLSYKEIIIALTYLYRDTEMPTLTYDVICDTIYFTKFTTSSPFLATSLAFYEIFLIGTVVLHHRGNNQEKYYCFIPYLVLTFDVFVTST